MRMHYINQRKSESQEMSALDKRYWINLEKNATIVLFISFHLINSNVNYKCFTLLMVFHVLQYTWIKQQIFNSNVLFHCWTYNKPISQMESWRNKANACSIFVSICAIKYKTFCRWMIVVVVMCIGHRSKWICLLLHLFLNSNNMPMEALENSENAGVFSSIRIHRQNMLLLLNKEWRLRLGNLP